MYLFLQEYIKLLKTKVKEFFISLAIFVFCISFTVFSQLKMPKVANAIEANNNLESKAILNKTVSQPKNNIFELDPSDPNPLLFAMADQTNNQENSKITESGLSITDIAVGEGDQAKQGQTVTVNYTGTLENGDQFDTSIGRAPFSFPLGAGRVIKGWDEGVVGMKVGGKRRLTIPPELGYGSRGAGNVIPPNATLTFEVELLEVEVY